MNISIGISYDFNFNSDIRAFETVDTSYIKTVNINEKLQQY